MDAKDLSRLMEQHRGALVRLACRKGLDEAAAEDLAQRVLVDASRQMKERKVLDEAAWIRGVARNKLKHAYRSRLRQQRLLGEAEQIAIVQRDALEGSGRPGISLRYCLSFLEHTERVALWLTQVAALTHEEAAQVMRFDSKTSVSKRVVKAEEKLKQLFSGVDP